MEREANLPPPPSSRPHPPRSAPCSSDFLRQVQAAFKRIRPHDKIQSSGFRARRILVPERGAALRNPTCDADLTADSENSLDVMSNELIEQRKSIDVVAESRGDLALTQASVAETVTNLYSENVDPVAVKKDMTNRVLESQFLSREIPLTDFQKKVQCPSIENAKLQRACDQMATRMDDLPSHLSSLALTELEWNGSNHMEFSGVSLKSDGGMSSLLAKRKSMLVQDQQPQFPAFLGKDMGGPVPQSSVVASSGATTTSVHSRSAPLLNCTTYSSCPNRDSSSHMEIEPVEEFNANPDRATQRDPSQPLHPASQCSSAMSAYSSAALTQVSISSIEIPIGVKDHGQTREQQGAELKESDRLQVASAHHAPISKDKSAQSEGCPVDITSVQSQAPVTKTSSSDVKMEPSKSDKSEKAVSSKGAPASRKKSYDPELFFKVSGKLYQKLGKIGTGGSSEVYKVISADCTIYALKRIKLKGRDYSTAYGFCQEIEYLTRLKGKNNIIQLIDYEVTDKTLLAEVMNGSKNVKDARIRDDGYIYVVLEYGEIDLAHMLSQKWKEMDDSNWNIDENWLRFYWQQILQAVNTIHEERIVHSDLKPANFLLVRGSLKLIDFGIAKAIMSDTTNIQRDSQVGTLSYMSPEAFMCNENDANGNPIKCGRPSDIWSLGCILYQMVYGRTPFSEYKTFWAKFKVITDRNHEIIYGPVSNPWLLDLMKKCLAWERNERWRIPQLLQHPFLVPPLSSLSRYSFSEDQGSKLFQQITEACRNDEESSWLCLQLQQLLRDPVPQTKSSLPTSFDQHCKMLSQMSSLCSQLRQRLTNIEKEESRPSV